MVGSVVELRTNEVPPRVLNSQQGTTRQVYLVYRHTPHTQGQTHEGRPIQPLSDQRVKGLPILNLVVSAEYSLHRVPRHFCVTFRHFSAL